MIVSNLKKSISELSDTEALAIIKDIRASRRVSKRIPETPKAEAKTRAKKAPANSKKPPSLDEMMASMTPEMAKKMLDMILKKGG